jgi:hypothetical protein
MNTIRRIFTFALTIGVSTLFAGAANAQTSPWMASADEARSQVPAADGQTQLAAHALSGDGRYLVFSSERALVPGDSNGVRDVFLRDRLTGDLTRISVSSTGEQADDFSNAPSISRDGRHVVFVSCAANLVADDINSQCDVFAHDRITGSTTLISSGPNGELNQFSWSYGSYAISADGRYIAFGAKFDSPQNYNDVWFRDRDSDDDGIYDEPGAITTTRISQPVIGGLTLFVINEIAMSSDGRWIAFAAATFDSSNDNGQRMFLHDRSASPAGSGTVVVDTPQYPYDPESWQHNSFGPDLSDDGHLVYYSSMPGLVPQTPQLRETSYLVDPYTLQHTLVKQTHATNTGAAGDWFPLMFALQPSISGDGRYVSYVGMNYNGSLYFMLVADMQTGISYDVRPHDDGTTDDWPGLMSLSADGNSLVFEATSNTFPAADGSSGVFVATRVAISPTLIDASNDGGSYSFAIELPAWMPWELDTSRAPGLLSVAPTTGFGPATVDVEVANNPMDEDVEYILSLGPAQVTIRQHVPMLIEFVSPNSGLTAGGDGVFVIGKGFKEGATISFDGVPGTDVQLMDRTLMIVTAPAHSVGTVAIVVTNPDGESATLADGYTYIDDTPPVVSASYSGTLGNDDWYTSNVTVQWAVVDDESPVTEQSCADATVTQDTAGTIVSCSATSAGGETHADVTVKRDATPPTIAITSPEPRSYSAGEAASITYDCNDATSGVASCTATQSGTLNTSTPGRFAFAVTAIDLAGHTVTSSVSYTVEKITPAIAWTAPAPITYGTPLGASQLSAETSVAGTFTYSPQAGTVLNAGTHTLSVTFTPTDSAIYDVAMTTRSITVAARPLGIFVNSSSKVYGEELPAFTVSTTDFVYGDSLASLSGSLTFATTATATSAPGNYGVTPGGVSSPNYSITFGSGTLAVGKANTSVTLATSPSPTTNNQFVTLTATVGAVPPGAGTPNGTVEFRDDGRLIGSGTLVNGVASMTIRLKRGSHPLTATYVSSTNYHGSAGSKTHLVN